MDDLAFLLIGSLAAVGAALSVGTIAALVRYRRTGTMPGSDEQVELSRGRVVSLWARVVVGIVVAMYGVVAMIDRGLL